MHVSKICFLFKNFYGIVIIPVKYVSTVKFSLFSIFFSFDIIFVSHNGKSFLFKNTIFITQDKINYIVHNFKVNIFISR